MSVNYSVAVPTVVGSILSAIGAGFILLCYMILPSQKHFRHALIINLAISDFINALNNSISGLYVTLAGHDIPAGSSCIANGFVGQLSVQATDVNILMIAVVTLLTLRGVLYIPDDSLVCKVLVCAAVWILPAITSSTALGLQLFEPIGGNWCWIQERPTYLRYVLTHGWRFLTIILSTGIYINIYIFFNHHFSNLRAFSSTSHFMSANGGSTNEPTGQFIQIPSDPLLNDDHTSMNWKEPVTAMRSASCPLEKPVKGIAIDHSISVHGTRVSLPPSHTSNSYRTAPTTTVHANIRPVSTIKSFGVAKQETKIKRTLLLNAYPIMYILLWIPGIANRISDATGHSSTVLQIMQSSTQFVGLANAITYGVNERVWTQISDRISGKGKPRRGL